MFPEEPVVASFRFRDLASSIQCLNRIGVIHYDAGLPDRRLCSKSTEMDNPMEQCAT